MSLLDVAVIAMIVTGLMAFGATLQWLKRPCLAIASRLPHHGSERKAEPTAPRSKLEQTRALREQGAG